MVYHDKINNNKQQIIFTIHARVILLILILWGMVETLEKQNFPTRYIFNIHARVKVHWFTYDSA